MQLTQLTQKGGVIMATIGNMAMTQIRMAQVATKYGVSSSNLFTKSTFDPGTS